MVKLLLSLVLLPTLALGQFSSPGIMQPATAAAAPSYDLYETFEATGYDNTWTEVGTGGTINEDATHATALSGGGSQCLEVAHGGTAAIRTQHDHGSSFTSFGARFYVNATATVAGNVSIWGVAGSPFFGVPCDVRLTRSGATVSLTLGGTTTQAWTISEDTWYLVEIHGTVNGGTVYMRVNGADEKSVTSTSNTARYIAFGSGGYYLAAMTFELDNYGMNFGTDAYP